MVWVTRHEWPSGARFYFNCYEHHALLVHNRAMGKSVNISSREEERMLWDRTLLIRKLKSEFPHAKQQRYADYGSTAGKFADIRVQFERRVQLGPNYGWFHIICGI